MLELTPQQAQNIVDKMMKDIPYNINIMDKTGVIIGSGNPKRVGTLHHGAAAAITQKRAVAIEQDEEFVKKGINLPIEMNGTVIGVVGISGELKETMPLGKLLRSAVILLIEQNIALDKENHEKNVKQQFFHQIIAMETTYTEEITSQAMQYGIELHKPSRVVYVEWKEEVDKNIVEVYPTFKLSKHSLCIIVQEPNTIEHLQKEILKQFSSARISISKSNKTIANGFLQSKSALRILKGILLDDRVIFYEKCAFLADLSDLVSKDKRTEQLGKIIGNDELIKTLQAYLYCNLNINETANRLIIHRNTLNYRLNRIKKLTGKDPRNILNLVELLFLLINQEVGGTLDLHT